MRAILTYHSIDDSGSAISVSPASFRHQMEWLIAEAVRVVSLGELLSLPQPARAAALTFDDGIANLATHAAPVLEQYGMTATVFVVSARVGKNNQWEAGSRHRVPLLPLLAWDELGGLAARGWIVGAHSRHHPWLPGCSDLELDEELEGAADDIAAGLGTRPQWFAYPYGEVDPRVAARTATAYEAACTADLRPLRGRENPVRLPRIDAYYLRSWVRRAGWGSPGFRAIMRARRIIRVARSAALT
jgi:peptidoglycan/xylan/chitin deacetylase (PgdA/CDA1 family)